MLIKRSEKGANVDGQRARKVSLDIEKALKEFRKSQSIIQSKMLSKAGTCKFNCVK